MVTSLRPKPGPARSYHFPAFCDEILPSGIRLVTAPVAKLPVVTVLVIVDAGSTNDSAGKEGVAALTAGTLLEGTKRLDGAELAEKFEQLGTSVETGADWDSAFIKLTVLSGELERAAMLLGDAISSPENMSGINRDAKKGNGVNNPSMPRMITSETYVVRWTQWAMVILSPTNTRMPPSA